LSKAIENKYDIVYDGTGKNYDKYLQVMTELKEKGYTLYLCIVMARDKDIISKRIRTREIETRRAVPPEIIEEAYGKLKTNVDKYLNLGCDTIKNIFLYDNTYNTVFQIRSVCDDKNNKTFTVNPIKEGGRQRVKSRGKSRSKLTTKRAKSRSKSTTKRAKSRSKTKK